MNSNLNRLFFVSVLSVTMAACTPNSVVDNNNTAAGGSYNNSNTATNTNTNTNSNTNTSTNSNTTSTEGYIYNGGYTNSDSDSTEVTTGEVVSNEVVNNYDTSGSTTNNNNYTGGNRGQKGFVVQLTASISQAKTDKIKDTFVAEGYPVIQNSLNRNGQILYRVQIGPYATKAEARTVFAKLKNRYQHNPYVKSSFINENK